MKQKQVSVRLPMPADLHARLKSQASLARTTLTDWLLKILAKASERGGL